MRLFFVLLCRQDRSSWVLRGSLRWLRGARRSASRCVRSTLGWPLDGRVRLRGFVLGEQAHLIAWAVLDSHVAYAVSGRCQVCSHGCHDDDRVRQRPVDPAQAAPPGAARHHRRRRQCEPRGLPYRSCPRARPPRVLQGALFSVSTQLRLIVRRPPATAHFQRPPPPAGVRRATNWAPIGPPERP